MSRTTMPIMSGWTAIESSFRRVRAILELSCEVCHGTNFSRRADPRADVSDGRRANGAATAAARRRLLAAEQARLATVQALHGDPRGPARVRHRPAAAA